MSNNRRRETRGRFHYGNSIPRTLRAKNKLGQLVEWLYKRSVALACRRITGPSRRDFPKSAGTAWASEAFNPAGSGTRNPSGRIGTVLCVRWARGRLCRKITIAPWGAIWSPRIRNIHALFVTYDFCAANGYSFGNRLKYLQIFIVNKRHGGGDVAAVEYERQDGTVSCRSFSDGPLSLFVLVNIRSIEQYTRARTPVTKRFQVTGPSRARITIKYAHHWMMVVVVVEVVWGGGGGKEGKKPTKLPPNPSFSKQYTLFPIYYYTVVAIIVLCVSPTRNFSYA